MDTNKPAKKGKSSGLVERTCWCGTKFMAKKSDVKRGWGNSCNKSCAASAREKKTGNYARFCESRDLQDGLYYPST